MEKPHSIKKEQRQALPARTPKSIRRQRLARVRKKASSGRGAPLGNIGDWI